MLREWLTANRACMQLYQIASKQRTYKSSPYIPPQANDPLEQAAHHTDSHSHNTAPIVHTLSPHTLLDPPRITISPAHKQGVSFPQNCAMRLTFIC